MSCSTKASRSAGVSVSSTTSSARPRESARTASCSGSALVGARCAAHGRGVDRLFPPCGPRAQHVQRDPGHDRGQPAAQVLHPVGSGAAEPQPGFLHGVVSLARRAEDPVGHGPQMGPVLLEPLGQPVTFVHRSRFSVAHCHINDRRHRADVTGCEQVLSTDRAGPSTCPDLPARSCRAPASPTACRAPNAASVVTANGMICSGDVARICASGHGRPLATPRRPVAHDHDERVQQQERYSIEEQASGNVRARRAVATDENSARCPRPRADRGH